MRRVAGRLCGGTAAPAVAVWERLPFRMVTRQGPFTSLPPFRLRSSATRATLPITYRAGEAVHRRVWTYECPRRAAHFSRTFPVGIRRNDGLHTSSTILAVTLGPWPLGLAVSVGAGLRAIHLSMIPELALPRRTPAAWPPRRLRRVMSVRGRISVGCETLPRCYIS